MNGSENPPQEWRARQIVLARAIPGRRYQDAQSHGTTLAVKIWDFLRKGQRETLTGLPKAEKAVCNSVFYFKEPMMIVKIRRAQATVEYAVLLVVILGMVALFLTRTKGTLQNYHNTMVNRAATE